MIPILVAGDISEPLYNTSFFFRFESVKGCRDKLLFNFLTLVEMHGHNL